MHMTTTPHGRQLHTTPHKYQVFKRIVKTILKKPLKSGKNFKGFEDNPHDQIFSFYEGKCHFMP